MASMRRPAEHQRQVGVTEESLAGVANLLLTCAETNTNIQEPVWVLYYQYSHLIMAQYSILDPEYLARVFNQYFNVNTVCPSVYHGCDVTWLQHILWERGYTIYYNAYSGNESPTTSTKWPTLSPLSRHSHSCGRATETGQMTLEQANAVLLKSRTLSQTTKVRLIYKRVDFLGTANCGFEKLLLSTKVATMRVRQPCQPFRYRDLQERISTLGGRVKACNEQRSYRAKFLSSAIFKHDLSASAVSWNAVIGPPIP